MLTYLATQLGRSTAHSEQECRSPQDIASDLHKRNQLAMAAAQSSTRIWEDRSHNPATSPTNHNNLPRPAQLPSITTLTNELPPNAAPPSPQHSQLQQNRMSDQWSNGSNSIRSSGWSTFSPHTSVTTPYRSSITSQGGNSSCPSESGAPASAVTSPGFAATSHSVGLAQPHQENKAFARVSHSSDPFPDPDSRRSSISSSVHSGLNNLNINNAAGSHGVQLHNHGPVSNAANSSQMSITAALQRERGILGPSAGRYNSPLHVSPLPLMTGPKAEESRQAYQARSAPVISNNPMREVYNADKPTAGQPYAFPDPDMAKQPPSESMDRDDGDLASRRVSNGTSTSGSNSTVTRDSRLPPGQHRLDEASGMAEPQTHHHTLHQNKGSTVDSNGDADSLDGSTPYSRTPALRASHKLAERKRRTEMKFLFDQLRLQIPSSHGSKASKWEILAKASDHIKNLETVAARQSSADVHLRQMSTESEAMRRENDALRQELYRLTLDSRYTPRPQTPTPLNPHMQSYAVGHPGQHQQGPPSLPHPTHLIAQDQHAHPHHPQHQTQAEAYGQAHVTAQQATQHLQHPRQTSSESHAQPHREYSRAQSPSGGPMQLDSARGLPPLTNGMSNVTPAASSVSVGSSMQGVQYMDDARR